MEKEPVITACTIGPMPRPLPQGLGDPMPEVNVTLNDGCHKMLFCFYPDEISFSEKEFIGLTEEMARNLKFQKDKRYLRS